MARAWRIEYEGALYHVLSRGNQRQNIVTNDDDRYLFLNTVGEMAERFEIDIFTYVLMDNHYHHICGNRKVCQKNKKALSSGYTPY
jgi:REP element-mobilizing transposase RayT